MERSYAQDVTQLGYGAGQSLTGEGILAITKAILQSGVSYVGGYPGAPISHLLDVLAEANTPLREPMGIHFEVSGSEAAAAALLGASINYPVRGVVTWKSVVGTNVADYDLGCEVARAAGLVTGYGEVRRRMIAAVTALLESVTAAAALDPAAARELAEQRRSQIRKGPEGEAAALHEARHRLEALGAGRRTEIPVAAAP